MSMTISKAKAVQIEGETIIVGKNDVTEIRIVNGGERVIVAYETDDGLRTRTAFNGLGTVMWSI